MKVKSYALLNICCHEDGTSLEILLVDIWAALGRGKLTKKRSMKLDHQGV